MYCTHVLYLRKARPRKKNKKRKQKQKQNKKTKKQKKNRSEFYRAGHRQGILDLVFDVAHIILSLAIVEGTSRLTRSIMSTESPSKYRPLLQQAMIAANLSFTT